MASTKLILTRHGETDWNAERRIQGHTDIGLNPRGIAQSESLADYLAGAGISVIFSSDLDRAKHTAGIVQSRIAGCELITTPLLRERNWGALEGKTRQEIAAQFPEDAEIMKNKPSTYAPPGGESKTQRMLRVQQFFEEYIDPLGDITALVVAHGGVCSLFMRRVLGLGLGGRTPFRIDNCSVTEFERGDDGIWIVRGFNCVCHLTARGLLG